MICRKCHAEAPDTPYCPLCGTKQEVPTRKPKRRGNGQGCVYQDRNSTWIAQVTKYKNGKRTVHRKYGFKTKSEANKYLASIVTNGLADRRAMTLQQVWEKWTEYHFPQCTAPRIKEIKHGFRLFDPLLERVFTDITPHELQACIDSSKNKSSSKRKARSTINMIYNYAIMENIATKNNASFLRVSGNDVTPRPAFTREEIEIIKNAIGRIPYADYVYCMIYTGFRPTAFFALRPEDYDPENRTLTGGIKTEAGKNRVVTLSPKIIDIVETLSKTDNKYIFHNRSNGKQLNNASFSQIFSTVMEALNIKDRVPYSCRHTFANLLKTVAGSDTEKAHLMGHASANMTKYYQSAELEFLKRITDEI